jgi:integrase
MLTDSSLRSRKPGVYSDKGGAPGLRLRVEVVERRDRKSGKVRTVVHRRWFVRLVIKGQKDARGRVGVPKDIGLGSAGDQEGEVGLLAARDLARQYRALARLGVDPVEARDTAIEAEAKARAEAAAKAVTFRTVCEEYIAAHAGTWTKHHADAWKRSLLGMPDKNDKSDNPKRHGGICAVLGNIAVGAIERAHVLEALQPLWTKYPETASRVRSRMELVLDAATARGLRSGANPAQWRGGLKSVLPAPRKLSPVKHFDALPWRDVPSFWTALQEREEPAARALSLVVLTGCRSGEARGAVRSEVDVTGKLWRLPATRTKQRREHVVPLSAAALALVEIRLAVILDGPRALLFPGELSGEQLHDPRLSQVMRRMGYATATPHGLRASFRTWAQERSGAAWETAEACLGHVVGNRVERSYARSDLLEARRELLEAWAAFVTGAAGAEVVDFAEKRSVSRGA